MSPIIIIAFVVIVVLGIAITILRQRRGGPGFGVQGWVPRSLRGKMNESYKEHGWREPYDSDGNLNQEDNNKLL